MRVKDHFYMVQPKKSAGLPRWLVVKESACQCRSPNRWGFHPWVGKILWRREWQPTPVFLPGESHGQRSLVGYSLWGHRESDMPEWLSTRRWLFFMCTESVSNLLSSLGRRWVSCHRCSIVLGARVMLLLHGFVAKRACLVLRLSKHGLWGNYSLSGVSHIYIFLFIMS